MRKPDFERLAIQYLNDQDVASRLENLVLTVAEWRRHDEAPGRRRARKADLVVAPILVDMVVGAVWYRLLNEHAAFDEVFTTGLADVASAAARASWPADR